MKTKILVTAALIAAVAGTAAFADGSRGRGMMPTFDFSAADVDASGGLTREEFGAYLQTLQGTAQAGRAAALVEAGDTDGDGLLSVDELQTVMTQMRERVGERGGDRDGERHGRQRAESGERGEHGSDRRARGMARMFDRIDANSDEVIDAEELAQAQARMQERMEGRREGRSNG